MPDSYAILRIAKLTSLNKCRSAVLHNARAVKVKSVVDENIKNPKIVFPQLQENENMTYSEFFKKRTSEQKRKIRKDAVRGLELVMLVSNRSLTNEEKKTLIKACFDFACENFNGSQNIYKIYAHEDEVSMFHLHLILCPVDENGQLNARAFINGSKKMTELQNKFYEKVKFLGNIKRGKPKEMTKAEHKSSVQWHKEQAEKEARLKTYEQIFGKPLDWSLSKRMHYYDIYDNLIKETETKTKNQKIKFNDIGR